MSITSHKQRVKEKERKYDIILACVKDEFKSKAMIIEETKLSNSFVRNSLAFLYDTNKLVKRKRDNAMWYKVKTEAQKKKERIE